MRRSITIADEIHKYIIELRGWFSLEKHVDIDYTTTMNLLTALGANLMSTPERMTENDRGLIQEAIESDSEFKTEAAADEWWNRRLRADIPNYNPKPETPQKKKVSAKEKGK